MGETPTSLRSCRPLSGHESRGATPAWGAGGGRFDPGMPDHSGIFQPVGILALIQAIQVRILVPEPNEHEPRSAAPASGAGDGGCDSHVLDHCPLAQRQSIRLICGRRASDSLRDDQQAVA